MARDFASRQRKKSQAESVERPRGAVPKAADPDAPESGTGLWSRLPPWGWLSLGLVAGFLLAQLFQGSASEPASSVVATVEETTPEVEAAEPVAHRPRFDFYTLLPESEVIAPKIEAYRSTPRDAEDLPRFMLQVGSFRSLSDAERHRERLRGLGFEGVRINAVETPSGDTWHRVQVGPFQDRRILARAQDDLARAGFDFMMLRLRDEPDAAESSAAPVESRDQLTE